MQPTRTSDRTDDENLVARVNEGDEAAFEVLYDRHREWAYRMACRICGCEHRAQDVLQEVFGYFLGKIPGFRLTCKFRTFLYPAIRNLSLSSLQFSRRFVGGASAEATIDQLPSRDPAPSGLAEILRIIANLSADHREIILFRFVDGMTLPEIAELIGIPLGTAKSRLHHALSALRSDPELMDSVGRLNDPDSPTA